MAVPPGTPISMTVTIDDGSEGRAVWPAGVDGLWLAPQTPGDHAGAWIVVHESGRFMCVARDMHRSLHLARHLGYVADWTRPLAKVLSEPGITAACARIVKDFR